MFAGFGSEFKGFPILSVSVPKILSLTDSIALFKLSEYQVLFLTNQDKGFIIGCFVSIGVINKERNNPTKQKPSRYPPVRNIEINNSLLFTNKSTMIFRIVGKINETITEKESKMLAIAERYLKNDNRKENNFAKKVP